MDSTSPTPFDSSHTEVTLDATPRIQQSGDSGSGSAAQCSAIHQVALVEGTGPELTQETVNLLRGRLRLASMLLAGGFGAFLLKALLESGGFAGKGFPGLAWFHLVTTCVIGLIAWKLCRQCPISLGWLRTLEVVVFGLPCVLFLCLQYVIVLESCRRGFYFAPAGMWLLLIFLYALFIPNTLRRATVVIGVIAAVPIVLLVVMLVRYPELANVEAVEEYSSFVLMIVLSAVAGVFGVDTIGTLRREAFEARQLGQYRLKERIGVGGMGEVYLAEHQLLKRACVVKLIRPDKAGDPKTLARFQREVRATAKLTHWNTVEIFDYGSTEDGTFYYVMELLPGMSLKELVERDGPLPPGRVIYLLRQACDALAEAHAAGLVHRDIKPGNVFAAQRGGVYDVVKVLDFGLVKPMIEAESVQLTADGSITGSPLYMSPEQALGETDPCPCSDIYSLGAVAYFLLTGRPPFEGDKPIKVMIAHAHQEVEPPSRHNPTIPADLEQVILRCLAKSPKDRFPDAPSLERALAACSDVGGWSREEAAAWWNRRREALTV